MDIDKLIKLLTLTQSQNDHEALSAIRKVNSILADNGQTWQSIIGVKNRPAENKKAPGLGEMIKFLLNNNNLLTPMEYSYLSQLTCYLLVGQKISRQQANRVHRIYTRVSLDNNI